MSRRQNKDAPTRPDQMFRGPKFLHPSVGYLKRINTSVASSTFARLTPVPLSHSQNGPLWLHANVREKFPFVRRRGCLRLSFEVDREA